MLGLGVDDGVPRYWQGSHEKQETSVTSSGWSVGAMHGRAIDSSSSYSCSCSGRGMSVPACVNRKRDSGLSSPGADSSLPVSTGRFGGLRAAAEGRRVGLADFGAAARRLTV